MGSSTHAINGNPVMLRIDRAIGELRRGRGLLITDGSRRLLVGAVETMPTSRFARLQAAADTPARLLLTAERARALDLHGRLTGPVALVVPNGAPVDALRALAGVTGADAPAIRWDFEPAPDCALLAAAGFELAKAGRLLPALIATDVDTLPGNDVLQICLTDIEHRARFVRHRPTLTSIARVPLTDALECEIALFRDEHGLGEHVAVVIGNPDRHAVVPVRLHSACLTGDLLGSLRCDCGEQLKTAVSRIAALGSGVLLYLDQEGRGIGLANKLRAYALQDTGLDTVDADQHLGFFADERHYDVAAALLQELGLTRISLLTNNPQKINALREHGIDVVGRLPLVAASNSHNERYMKAKLERAGHLAEESGG